MPSVAASVPSVGTLLENEPPFKPSHLSPTHGSAPLQQSPATLRHETALGPGDVAYTYIQEFPPFL